MKLSSQNPLLQSATFMKLSKSGNLFAVVAASLSFAHTAHAANGTWLNTGATNANWSEATNWVGSIVPGATVAISGTNADTSIATFNTALAEASSACRTRRPRNRPPP